MRRLLPILLALSACQPSAVSSSDPGAQSSLASQTSKRYALVFGGADEAPDPGETISDQFGGKFVEDVTMLTELGYDTTVLFSNGMANIPQQADALTKLTAILGAQPAGFALANLNAALADLQNKVQAGDEVLITVITHGFACEGDDAHEGDPNSFCVALGWPRPADSWAEMPLDAIKPSLDVFAQRGALTGLMVMTCDSGYAMRLGTASTCVISATGHDTSRNVVMLDAIVGHAQSGMTLDALYAAAAPDVPQLDLCDACGADHPCPAPCETQDTPWISSQQGEPDDACAAFTL